MISLGAFGVGRGRVVRWRDRQVGWGRQGGGVLGGKGDGGRGGLGGGFSIMQV
jgi:hypothetical protein